MLAEPPPTPYDLTFPAFGFPVRVHPLFWLTTVILGWSGFQDPPDGLTGVATLALWIACVFVCILVHELGHAFASRWNGGNGRIWLYWFGGLAASDGRPLRPWPAIAVALAGPAAGFLLAGVVFGTDWATDWGTTRGPAARELYWQLMGINIGWGLMNLLPVWPLDGGRVCREVCSLLRVRRAEVVSLRVSVGVGAAIAAWCLLNHYDADGQLLAGVPAWARFGSLYTGFLFGSLAYSSYEALRVAQRRDALWQFGDDDAPPWRR